MHHVLAEELAAGDIDADEERIAIARQDAMPCRRLVQRLAENVAAEFHDQAGFLRKRDEIARRQTSACRMIPAHERLEASKLVRGQARDRLIEHRNLLALQRHAQFAFEREAVLLFRAHRGIENLDTVGPLALGAQHRQLAVPQHFLCVGLRPVMHHDADRGGEDDFLRADLHRCAERTAHPLRQGRDVMGVAVGNQEDRKLIAAETGQRILRVEVAGQAAPQRQEHRVPDHETEALVDVLEAVDVDEENGRAVRLPLCRTRDGAVQTVHK